jgi:hypothetical protein
MDQFSIILPCHLFPARRKPADLPDLEDGEVEFLDPVLFDSINSGSLGVVDPHTGGSLIHDNAGEFTVS